MSGDGKLARVLGNTESSWCRGVSSGTGNYVIAFQIARPPSEVTVLKQKLQKLQNSHPLLRTKLRYSTSSKEFSFVPSPTPKSDIEFHDVAATAKLLETLKSGKSPDVTPLQMILEHELNNNKWVDPDSFPADGIDVLFASLYALSETKAVVALKIHAASCDRTTANSVVRDVMDENGGDRRKNVGEGEQPIESLVPKEVGKKTIWGQGKSMLSYSVNAFRGTNLEFLDLKKPRASEVVRLQLTANETGRLLQGCKTRNIKLGGALAAAGLMAVHSTGSDKSKKKYGVVTLTDCRPVLEPQLSIHHFGFYHTAAIDLHSVKPEDKFWELAEKIYTRFADRTKDNKHLADMSEINYLLRKAVETPSLTASSSLRTSFISVFENSAVDDSMSLQKLGIESYIECSSAHGVGPSVAVFDTIRDGALDCSCVYPSPLHSRAQMTDLIGRMKRILLEGSNEQKV